MTQCDAMRRGMDLRGYDNRQRVVDRRRRLPVPLHGSRRDALLQRVDDERPHGALECSQRRRIAGQPMVQGRPHTATARMTSQGIKSILRSHGALQQQSTNRHAAFAQRVAAATTPRGRRGKQHAAADVRHDFDAAGMHEEAVDRREVSTHAVPVRVHAPQQVPRELQREVRPAQLVCAMRTIHVSTQCVWWWGAAPQAASGPASAR